MQHDHKVVSLQSPTERPRRHVRALHQLRTIEQLDRRSGAFKRYHQIISGLERDLGPLNTLQTGLARAFALATLTVEHLSVMLATGEAFDLTALSGALSATVRIAAKLGIDQRAASDAPPNLDQYLQQREQDDDGDADH